VKRYFVETLSGGDFINVVEGHTRLGYYYCAGDIFIEAHMKINPIYLNRWKELTEAEAFLEML
jgi:hypothetical protein